MTEYKIDTSIEVITHTSDLENETLLSALTFPNIKRINECALSRVTDTRGIFRHLTYIAGLGSLTKVNLDHFPALKKIEGCGFMNVKEFSGIGKNLEEISGKNNANPEIGLVFGLPMIHTLYSKQFPALKHVTYGGFPNLTTVVGNFLSLNSIMGMYVYMGSMLPFIKLIDIGKETCPSIRDMIVPPNVRCIHDREFPSLDSSRARELEELKNVTINVLVGSCYARKTTSVEVGTRLDLSRWPELKKIDTESFTQVTTLSNTSNSIYRVSGLPSVQTVDWGRFPKLKSIGSNGFNSLTSTWNICSARVIAGLRALTEINFDEYPKVIHWKHTACDSVVNIHGEPKCLVLEGFALLKSIGWCNSPIYTKRSLSSSVYSKTKTSDFALLAVLCTRCPETYSKFMTDAMKKEETSVLEYLQQIQYKNLT